MTYPTTSKMCMTFSFPVTFTFDLYTSNIVTLDQRYVSTKLEVSNTSLLRENRRNRTDGWTDRVQRLMLPHRESHDNN